ncbi:MAG: hypothetical protein IH986_08980 [Planctomycetes bacterium]|nr:hypothetical protein [Planctomycetota bacterium]
MTRFARLAFRSAPWQRTLLSLWVLIPLVLCAAGCASRARHAGLSPSGPGGRLPLGQWEGEGSFVYEQWKGDDEGPKSIQRSYPTTLSLRKARLDGHDVIEMEIRSRHGGLPDMGEETYLLIALTEAKRVSEATVLYRVVAQRIEDSPSEALSFDDDAQPFQATCTTRDGVTVLQIPYTDNFVDTLRFEGDHVEKTGVFFHLDEGLIHWVERLRKK